MLQGTEIETIWEEIRHTEVRIGSNEVQICSFGIYQEKHCSRCMLESYGHKYNSIRYILLLCGSVLSVIWRRGIK